MNTDRHSIASTSLGDEGGDSTSPTVEIGHDSDLASRIDTWEIPRAFVPRHGRLLAGTFRVRSWIGGGGMGCVVLARDEKLERDVAIKFVLPELLQRPDIERRFLCEARSLARVRHENVVTVYAWGSEDGVPYIVMEYVPGTSLKALLPRGGVAPASLSEQLPVLSQLCAAVDAIHAMGLVHRDLKPSNVLVGPDSRIVVTDFGLARSLHEHGPEPSEPIGSPAYVCPEVLRGLEPGPASDIYSLAVIVYELLTGRRPFGGRSITDVLDKQRYQQPLHPSDVWPGLSRASGDAILCALDKSPTRRPASASEFLAQLVATDRATKEGPTQARGGGSLAFATGIDPPPVLSGRRVLVADDDSVLRDRMRSILADVVPDAVVETVPDGAAALRRMEVAPPSLAVIDLLMPGMSGMELTAAIRGHSLLAATPILIVTGVGGASDWQVLSALGANGFLVKPFATVELEIAVRRLLGMSLAPAVV
ncbi:protein kinase domain-containing protein [Haliangium sp.]|uniref:protein kinase domain-containing protein n=1 Tax=Haliangium sp. TaxID=2663208 RepID=UPI003D13FF96